MTGKAGKYICATAVTAGLALVGASFHGVAGLDRELALAVAREQPRTQLIVHEEPVVRGHDCPGKPDWPS